jgi:hypothetical protein
MFRPEDVSHSCPYALFLVISDALLRLYDDSVWAMRDHISQWEAVSLVHRACQLAVARLICDDREGHKRPTTSSCTRLRDTECTSVRLSTWHYCP